MPGWKKNIPVCLQAEQERGERARGASGAPLRGRAEPRSRAAPRLTARPSPTPPSGAASRGARQAPGGGKGGRGGRGSACQGEAPLRAGAGAASELFSAGAWCSGGGGVVGLRGVPPDLAKLNTLRWVGRRLRQPRSRDCVAETALEPCERVWRERAAGRAGGGAAPPAQPATAGRGGPPTQAGGGSGSLWRREG